VFVEVITSSVFLSMGLEERGDIISFGSISVAANYNSVNVHLSGIRHDSYVVTLYGGGGTGLYAGLRS
jgi:hypothetical protein